MMRRSKAPAQPPKPRVNPAHLSLSDLGPAPRRVLFVVTHAAHPVLGESGLFARHVARRDNVQLLLLTAEAPAPNRLVTLHKK